MKMIWQLFNVHIIVISIILILFIAWLVWPHKYIKIRKIIIKLSGLVTLVGITLAAYTYWPRQYDKEYLNAPISPEIKLTPLRVLADSIDFHIGVAMSPGSVYEPLIAQQFNSIVAENHFKPGKLLKNTDQWEFDFSRADKLIGFSNIPYRTDGANRYRQQG